MTDEPRGRRYRRYFRARTSVCDFSHSARREAARRTDGRTYRAVQMNVLSSEKTAATRNVRRGKKIEIIISRRRCIINVAAIRFKRYRPAERLSRRVFLLWSIHVYVGRPKLKHKRIRLTVRKTSARETNVYRKSVLYAFSVFWFWLILANFGPIAFDGF